MPRCAASVISLLLGIAAMATPGPSLAGWADAPKIPTCDVTFGPQNLHFAHCPNAQRDFTSVIVAVPGWNGSCGGTFGSGAESMYSVLDPRRFYDWDCYDYDSHNWHIQASAAGLAAQVADLRNNDHYKNILFVTHSTGGIVVLEYLTQRLFAFDDANRTYTRRPDPATGIATDLKMPEAVMWAAPINGLNWYVSIAGNFTGDNEQTLPDLNENSDYLRGLKQRLTDYYTWEQSLPSDQVLDARISLLFLQSDTDGVVRSIDTTGTNRPSWLWPLPDGEVQKTHQDHLDISDSGNWEALHIPTLVNNDIALIKAPLDIRLKDVFLDAPPTDTATARQDAVIQGVTYFSSQQFQSAIVPALKLMIFMLGNDFVRSAHVDETLVDTLLRLYDQQFSDPEAAAQAAALLNASGAHDFGANSPTVAGANAPSYIKKIADLLEKIRQKSAGIDPLGLQIDQAALVAEGNIATRTRAADVRDYALGIVKAEMKTASTTAILNSGVLSKLTTSFYTPNASTLPSSSKSLFADILQSAIERGGDVQTNALSSVNAAVMFRGESQPLWRSLQQDRFTDYLDRFQANQKIELAPPAQKSELLDLNLNMVKGVGTQGNGATIAVNALQRLEENATIASPATKDIFVKLNQKSTLDDISAWPGLNARANQVFKAYGAPGVSVSQ